MTEALLWDNKPVKVKLSKRKTLALHVIKGQVELRGPYDLDLNYAQQFIHAKDSWLRKVLAQQAVKQADQIDYTRANSIPLMGVNVPVKRHHTSNNPSWELTDQGLALYADNFDSAQLHLALLESFYKAQARFWLRNKTLELVQQTTFADKLTDVRIRKTKTKWGHCTAQGRIQYNWLIMMAPEPVIDYLISHEVSHLKHLNHSAQFWQQVEQLHPTYLKDRQWLRNHEHRLTLE